MEVYKLLRKLKSGELAPLFINKKMRLPFGVWLEAELYPTKGYAERKGWHCCIEPYAPHLSERDRVWVRCEAEDIEYYERPESQGGVWVLAQRIKLIEELE